MLFGPARGFDAESSIIVVEKAEKTTPISREPLRVYTRSLHTYEICLRIND